jgi:hypothetical protein
MDHKFILSLMRMRGTKSPDECIRVLGKLAGIA